MKNASVTTPLIDRSGKACLLYEASVMLEMDEEVAQGYVILLSGDAEQVKAEKRVGKISDSAVTLGFVALIEGNAIDACFGVKRTDSRNTRGAKRVKEAKSILSDAVESDDAMRRRAVETYRDAFQAATDFQRASRRLNCITRCFVYGKLQRKTLKKLKTSFNQLEESIMAVL